MGETVTPCVYFAQTGPTNTARTLQLVRARAEALNIGKVLVATTSGATGVQAAQTLQGLDVVVVTHSTGFRGPDIQELTDENRATIEAAGATILTCQHAFGGMGGQYENRICAVCPSPGRRPGYDGQTRAPAASRR